MGEGSNIHAGHKKRMRDRFIENESFAGFGEHEILELILNYVNIRSNTNIIAHELISRFGTVEGVINASVDDLTAVPGVGERTAVFLAMQRELFHLYERRKYTRIDKKHYTDEDYINSDFLKYLQSLFENSRDELIFVMCVDSSGKIRKAKALSKGVGDSVLINYREIVRLALNYNASGVIVAHNHVTGIAVPSGKDIKVTRKIEEILEAVNVKLVDHYILAGEKCVSILKDSNYIYAK